MPYEYVHKATGRTINVRDRRKLSRYKITVARIDMADQWIAYYVSPDGKTREVIE